MLRRWKRRLIWSAVLAGLALLAIPATVAQATAALRSHLRRRSTMLKLTTLVALLALAVAVGSGTLASASPATASQAMTLIAVDLPKSEVYVDAGAKGESPGDTLFFRETLLRGGKRAGGSEVMCVFASRNAGRCQGTLRLGGGTLEAAGGIHFDGTFSLPIVGGTGTYAGAQGVLRVIAVSERRSRYEVALSD
jgi:hypothetical protein